MSDAAFGMVLFALVAVAVAGYRQRVVLQPNRGASVAYAAGTITWGLALFVAWAAWASGASSSVCAEQRCEELVEAIEEQAPEIGDEIMLSSDLVE